ncbi:MAG: hypothetical protein ABII07_05465 [Patescibacteria group bacterium]|nr:hypothetical protein [Patescibacteria group bacterium]
MKQEELLKILTKNILNAKRDHPVRVCIDGVDASGKTTLADSLAIELQKHRPVIRVSIDGFHNPKEIRYQKGRNSPVGYYMDTTDYEAFINAVLKPLGPNGNLQYKTAVFDFIKNSKVDSPVLEAEESSILLMDGVFLLRPELVDYWDLKIFVDVDFKITVKRASKRDGYYLGEEHEIFEKYEQRYVPGQKIYFKDANPKEKADIIIDNSNFENPLITKL